MNIIDERNIRTIKRKIKKKEYDDMMTLSVPETGQRVRLLDEGMVVDSVGNPWFYIKKGTLQKYMNALPDDYEGSINLGHMDFATFPFLLGKWNKSDLTLVDIGDGRQGLDVNLRLDPESFIVKELKRADYDFGVSAEFGFTLDEAATEKYQLEIIEEIFIRDFAIVGEAGNVNSSNITLKGGTQVTIKELNAMLENEQNNPEDLSSLNDLLDKALSTEETKEEEVADESEETETTEETTEAEAAADDDGAEDTEDEQFEEEEGSVNLAAVMDLIQEQRDEIKALKEQLAEKNAQLAAKTKDEEAFMKKFKTLTSLVREDKEPEVKPHKIGMTNGIGEL